MRPRRTIRRRLAALGRAWAFGRHIPARKILRRLDLILARALRERGLWPAPRVCVPSPALSATAPLPLFQPRAPRIPTGISASSGGLPRDCDDPGTEAVTPLGAPSIARGADGLVFTFLGHAHAMGAAIDWAAPSPAPAWQLWRMNLHYMAYLETVDDALFLSLVSGWIAANPPDRPGAFTDAWNTYALSIRIVVWMGEMTRRGLVTGAHDLTMVLASLAAQLSWLERMIETDIGGNHLVKNIKALLWAAAFFAGPDARRWKRRGMAALRAVLREQILPDGLHYERSPSYHCQVFADLLDCRRALATMPEAAMPALDEALRAMAQATADLAHPDGLVAQFNDAGLTMAPAPQACLDAFSTLFGSCPRPRAGFAFAAAGYFGRRSEDEYVIVDCGPIAPDDLPAHGHGDILSFEWSVAGQRIVVDQGVFEYTEGARRTAARSAENHNTLCFEDADQADFYGAFRCGRRPKVSILRLDLDADRVLLEGTHDGFSHLPGAPRHIRRIEAVAGALRIVDRIEGRPDRPAHIGILLHPEVTVTPLPGGLRLARGGAVIHMRSSAGVAVRAAVHWPDMGTETTTKRLLIAIDRGTREVITTFEVATSNPRRARDMS